MYGYISFMDAIHQSIKEEETQDQHSSSTPNKYILRSSYTEFTLYFQFNEKLSAGEGRKFVFKLDRHDDIAF